MSLNTSPHTVSTNHSLCQMGNFYQSDSMPNGKFIIIRRPKTYAYNSTSQSQTIN